MAIALYARKSVEKENSISCDTQIEYCKAMIKPDERQEKVLTFVDNGFSGGNVNREGFQNMMRKIEQGKITKVLVYRLDRISRSLADFVGILNTFKEYGVEFVSTQEAFDTSSPYGELIVKILAVFAEFERESIISRVTQAYEHRSEMGFYMGGRQPYGFELEPTVINNIKTKKLKPIPNEIEQIKYIYDTYAVEQVTLGRLLKNLVESDMQSLSGGKWTTAKLSTIIKNPIYVKADNRIYEFFQRHNAQIISPPEAFDGIHGVQIYGKTKHESGCDDWSDIKVVVMTHEGVIDSGTWIKNNQKLAANKQIRNAVSNKTSWLGGKIICGRCGRTMTTIKGKTGSGEIRRYFTCTGKTHFRDCKGTKVTLYAESLEDMVYEKIAEKLDTLKNVRATEKKNINPEINELRNKIKAIELSQSKIADMLLSPDANADLLEIMNQKASKLKSEKTSLLIRIDELENNKIDAKKVVDLSKKWKTASFEEKRGVCQILINRIIIDEDGNAEIVWNI
jgi:site-specific DNA recombinase